MLSWDALFDCIDTMLVDVKDPSVEEIAIQYNNDPFKILISTLISLRTKDAVTFAASKRLFDTADTIEAVYALPLEKIEQLIFPCGFFRNKAKQIHGICDILIQQYQSHVPQDLDALLALPGVGLKTANLTLALAFDIPAICVDIHVHRILNRMGYIKTDTPDESEVALRKIVPLEHWIKINRLFVLMGQNICTPRAPRCTECLLKDHCQRNIN